MTAALQLLPARLDDDAPVAMWSAGEGTDLFVMPEDRARQLAEETRGLLGQAGANLVELRRGNAHIALRFDHFHEFAEFYFGDLMIWRLVKDRHERIAERQALVASLTLSGHDHREIRDLIGASLGTIVGDQRAQGLISSKPLRLVEDEQEPADPYRGLSPRWEALARVAAQGDRGLTSLELDEELASPIGTATGALSKHAARGLVVLDEVLERRRNRRPYRITDAGRARLAEVLAARDAAEEPTG